MEYGLCVIIIKLNSYIFSVKVLGIAIKLYCYNSIVFLIETIKYKPEITN